MRKSMSDREQRFSLRKLSVGTASVLVACYFLGGSVVVYGDTVSTTSDETRTESELSVAQNEQNTEPTASTEVQIVEKPVDSVATETEQSPSLGSASTVDQVSQSTAVSVAEKGASVSYESRSASPIERTSEQTEASSSLTLTVEQTDKHQARLRFSGDPNADAYLVYRTDLDAVTDSDKVKEFQVSASEFIDTDILHNHRYKYSARAILGKTLSQITDEVDFSIMDHVETEYIDDRDSRVQYGAAFNDWTDSSLYSGTEKYADITNQPTIAPADATMSLRFTGTGIRVYGIKSNALGTAKVQIDGREVEELNFYVSGATEKSVLIGEYQGLSSAEHEIRIQVDPTTTLGRKKISLDYFEVIQTQPRVVDVVDDRNSRIKYGAAFNDWTDSSLYSATEKYADITDQPTIAPADATMSLRFTGTGIRVYGIKSKALGTAKVQIDGREVEDLNFFVSGATEKSVLIGEYQGLSNDEHEIRIQVDPTTTLGRKKISLDYFEILQPAETVMNVLDYGADPSGKYDSTRAVQAAIEAAKKIQGPKKLVFPQGQYDFYPDKASERELYVSNTVGANQEYKNKKIGILLENIDDLTIDGSGSLFMFHGKMTTLATIDSHHVKFENFSIDFKVPTVVDLYTEAVDENSVTYYIPEAYSYEIDGNNIIWKSDVSPYTNQYYWTEKNQIRYTQVYNTVTGITQRSGNPVFQNIQKIEDLGNRRVKITYSQKNDSIVVGNSYQMRQTVRDHPGMLFLQSEDLVLDSLNVHFLHGFGVVAQTSTNFTINNTHFKAPEGSMRTTVGYADFVQVSGSKGLVRIENSSFENPHDDPINIHGTFLKVVERLADNKIKVQYMHNETAGFPSFFVGDEVEFATSGDMVTVANSKRKVVAVEGPTGRTTPQDLSQLKQIILTFDRALNPTIQPNTHVIENITYTPSVIIRNNHFRATPTRGVLVTTRKPVVIENNTFDGMHMAAIYISNDAQGWYESGPVRDVTIKNNTFYGTNATQPLIYIDPTNPRVSTSQTVHENIKIENNHFFVENTPVLNAKSVKNLQFIHNRIDRLKPDVSVTLSAPKTSLAINELLQLEGAFTSNRRDSELFVFQGSKNIVLADNQFDKGLNLAGRFTNQSSDEITGSDSQKIRFNTGRQLLSTSDNEGYVVSNPAIATVTETGLVRGLKAGRVAITKYVDINGSRYYSSPVYLEVSNQSVSLTAPLSLLSPSHRIEKPTVLRGNGTPAQGLVWKITNEDNSETNLASIDQAGLLTPLKHGVVKVTVQDKKGQSASQLYVVGRPEVRLNPDFSLTRPNLSQVSLSAENQVTIRADRGTLWAEANSNVNLLLKDVSQAENVTATVKLTGKPKASYDEAGLIFYQNDDNYVIVNRKYGNGHPAIHMVNEQSRRADESARKPEIASSTLYLKLSKVGNQVTGFYSVDGSIWTKVASVTNATLGSAFKVGVLAAGGDQTNTPFTFSDFSIENQSIPFAQLSDPKVGEVTVSRTGDMLTATLTADETAQESLIYWTVSDTENGPKTVLANQEGAQLRLTPSFATKYVSAYVIPKDHSQTYGNPVSSSAIYISPTELAALPSGDTRLISGEIAGQTVVASSQLLQQVLHLSGDTQSVNLSFSAHVGAKLEVLVDDQSVGKNQGNISMQNLAVGAGFTELVVKVTAADEKHVDFYRFVLRKTPVSAQTLSDLTINSVQVEGFDPEQSHYEYVTNENQVVIAARSTNQTDTVYITTRQGRQKSQSQRVSLQPGTNRVILSIVTQAGQTTYYELLIKVPSLELTTLESISTEGKLVLDQEFDATKTNYSGRTSYSSLPVTFKAENPQARINLQVNGQTFSATGVLTANLPIYAGENHLTLVIRTDDRHSKEYQFTIVGQEQVDLPLLDYTAQSVTGWGVIRKNQALNGGKLSLVVDGKRQYFDTGIAFHAPGKLEYDISDRGFTRFEALLGIDGSQTNYSSMKFTILVDGVERVVTPELTAAGMRTQAVSVDVTGAKKVTILSSDLGNNHSDHATLVQASFVTSLKKKSI